TRTPPSPHPPGHTPPPTRTPSPPKLTRPSVCDWLTVKAGEAHCDFLPISFPFYQNLKVQAPEGITAELERRRLDLIPEELQRQFVQTVQDNVLAEVQAHLQDFR
uniref:Regulator of G protein signalling-like domain-containing protein n=1 Tax=Callorhinchus milii TaxID=7868 RepID=A0A4W3I4U3_CALMI